MFWHKFLVKVGTTKRISQIIINISFQAKFVKWNGAKLNIEIISIQRKTLFTTLQVENWPCGGVSQCFISGVAVCAANWHSICSACACVKEAVAIKEHKYAARHAGKEMNILSRSLHGFFGGSFLRPIRITAQFHLFLFSLVRLPVLRLKISQIGDHVWGKVILLPAAKSPRTCE